MIQYFCDLPIVVSDFWTQPTFVTTECMNGTGKIGTTKFLFLGPGTIVDYGNSFGPAPGIELLNFKRLNHCTTGPNSSDLLIMHYKQTNNNINEQQTNKTTRRDRTTKFQTS